MLNTGSAIKRSSRSRYSAREPQTADPIELLERFDRLAAEAEADEDKPTEDTQTNGVTKP